MSKNKIQYVCNHCGGLSSKWAGQCADCEAWNSYQEVQQSRNSFAPKLGGYSGQSSQEVVSLGALALDKLERLASGLSELDRVLGGGLVPGSVVLIGGDPGIGKSTILLQTLSYLSESHQTLYITGEESLSQVKLRANRLGIKDAPLLLLAETQVEHILMAAHKHKPRVLVVDSVQTIFTEQVTSAPGSVSQLRESAQQLVRYAKHSGSAVFLVGHVTKEGTLAGPRVLEHMVDTVLYFEGEADSRFRIVRARKNRFGAVNELGIFAMTEKGLREISNPSAIFLSRYQAPVPGSVVMVTWEGSRPLLVEVQALVDESHASNPRRVTVGLEANRLALVLAVLNRHGQIATHDQDVFVSVVGGVRVTETAADLALVSAVISSLKNKALALDLVVLGELGLAGEIRPIQNGQERLREAAKHGFKRAIVPQANAPKQGMAGLEIHGVTHLQEALQLMF